MFSVFIKVMCWSFVCLYWLLIVSLYWWLQFFKNHPVTISGSYKFDSWMARIIWRDYSSSKVNVKILMPWSSIIYLIYIIYLKEIGFRLREHDFSKTKARLPSKWRLKTGGFVTWFKVIKKMFDQLKAAETAACWLVLSELLS